MLLASILFLVGNVPPAGVKASPEWRRSDRRDAGRGVRDGMAGGARRRERRALPRHRRLLRATQRRAEPLGRGPRGRPRPSSSRRWLQKASHGVNDGDSVGVTGSNEASLCRIGWCPSNSIAPFLGQTCDKLVDRAVCKSGS